MANPKEPHFFDNEEAFSGGNPPYDLYHKAFTPSGPHQILGEATPIYMYWKPAPIRISEYNPVMKLIILLRNPIERAYSQWNMNRIKGDETLPFLEAILSESTRCAEANPLQHRLFSYIDRGFYLTQLERLWSYFPKRQVLILRSEELAINTNQTLARIWAFLELPSINCAVKHGVHALSYPAPMEETARHHVTELFRAEIRGLERTLGWDLSHWIPR